MMERETGLTVHLEPDGDREILGSAELQGAAVLFMEPLEETIFERWELKGQKGYSVTEIQSLRDYLAGGGFIYLLTHGGASRALIGAKRLVRQILPGTALESLPENHPIFQSYYQLEGPLPYPYRRGFHQGETVRWLGARHGERLAILVDTEETLHVVDQWVKLKDQSRVYSHLAPAAAARLINLIVYATAAR